MIVNVVDDELRIKVHKKLKESFNNIKLAEDINIHFSLIDNKKYQIELINDLKDKSLFMGEDEFNSALGFKNLDYNIISIQNFIDDNQLLESFIDICTLDNHGDGEERSYYHSYDSNRLNDKLIEIYNLFDSYIEEGEIEIDKYDWESGNPLYFNFFGNKVQLCESKASRNNIFKNRIRKSDFVYFNQDIDEDGIKEIIEKLIKTFKKIKD